MTGILSEAHGGATPNDSQNCPPGQGLLEPPAHMRVCSSLSHARLCNPTDCSLQGSSVHGFSRQEYWSGLPFPRSGHLPDPWIERVSSALVSGFFTTEEAKEAILYHWGSPDMSSGLSKLSIILLF